jgi:hypothetical protein
MEASNQIHAPASLLPENQALVHNEHESGWAPEPTRILQRRQKSLPISGNKSQFYSLLAHNRMSANMYTVTEKYVSK